MLIQSNIGKNFVYNSTCMNSVTLLLSSLSVYFFYLHVWNLAWFPFNWIFNDIYWWSKNVEFRANKVNRNCWTSFVEMKITNFILFFFSFSSIWNMWLNQSMEVLHKLSEKWLKNYIITTENWEWWNTFI